MTAYDSETDHFRDACGLFAVIGHPEAANLTYLGLHGLQHRGQESAGIASSDGQQLHVYRRLGLVHDAFTTDVLERLPGTRAFGHVRYSTAGGTTLANTQPLVVQCRKGSIGVAHNGNLVNALRIREELEDKGAIFQTTTDTEVLVHLISSSGSDLADSICEALYRAHGSFSIVFMTERLTIAARDPRGIRPLCLGRLDNAWVVSSESVAFDLIGADLVRDVEPGELLVFAGDADPHSLRPFPAAEQRACLFEYVYFARPDSRIDGRSVYDTRKRMGQTLAEESPAGADIVIPVPDSGTAAALGFAQRSGLPFEQGLIRSHYVGRTFIEPKQSIRNFGVRLKLNPSRDVLADKRVVVIDDSIVRGTTSRKIVENVRRAGAAEVHMRISSPPVRHSCKYGIDTPTDEELIAHAQDVAAINDYLGADSLAYLSLEGLERAVGGSGLCRACFDGSYPIEFEDEGRQLQTRFEGL